jgi:hypothetical protein
MSKKNKDMMLGLKQQMKDNAVRWKKINAITEQLNKIEEDESADNMRSKLNTELLLLIVEQLRPAGDYEGFNENLKNFQKDVGTLVNQIMKTSGRK